MVNRQARYKIHNGSEFDVYHFETSANAVKVFDKNNGLIGDLSKLLFEGETKSNVNFRNIRVSGTYAVTRIEGLPQGVATNSKATLEVKAVGPIGDPDIVHYTLYDVDGNVYHNTVPKGEEAKGWASGGKYLKDKVEAFDRAIGTLGQLQTNKKGSLVDSLNELYDNNRVNASGLASLKRDYDNLGTSLAKSYLKLDENSQLSNVKLAPSANFKYDFKGQERQILGFSQSQFTIGNSKVPALMYGSGDLTYNDKKVWTEENDGDGSGLDADTLDGFHAKDFVRFGAGGKFDKALTFDAGIKFGNNILVNGNGNKLDFTGANGKKIASIDNDGILSGNGVLLEPNGNNGNPASLLFKVGSELKGVGFVRDAQTQKLSLVNSNQEAVMTLDGTGKAPDFTNYVMIGGRRLYMQDTQPVGENIPDGSLWIGAD